MDAPRRAGPASRFRFPHRRCPKPEGARKSGDKGAARQRRGRHLDPRAPHRKGWRRTANRRQCRPDQGRAWRSHGVRADLSRHLRAAASRKRRGRPAARCAASRRDRGVVRRCDHQQVARWNHPKLERGCRALVRLHRRAGGGAPYLARHSAGSHRGRRHDHREPQGRTARGAFRDRAAAKRREPHSRLADDLADQGRRRQRRRGLEDRPRRHAAAGGGAARAAAAGRGGRGTAEVRHADREQHRLHRHLRSRGRPLLRQSGGTRAGRSRQHRRGAPHSRARLLLPRRPFTDHGRVPPVRDGLGPRRGRGAVPQLPYARTPMDGVQGPEADRQRRRSRGHCHGEPGHHRAEAARGQPAEARHGSFGARPPQERIPGDPVARTPQSARSAAQHAGSPEADQRQPRPGSRAPSRRWSASWGSS